MRILVDKARCAGHARCYATAPEIFVLDDNGYIDMESFDVQPGQEELARRGARAVRSARCESSTRAARNELADRHTAACAA
jgi:ferredoxin